MLMKGHFLKCRGKKRRRAWAPSQQHQPRALCTLSMRFWNDAPRADASRLRSAQLWSAKLSLPSPSRRCEVLERAVDLVQIKGLGIKSTTDPVHHLLMLGVLRVL